MIIVLVIFCVIVFPTFFYFQRNAKMSNFILSVAQLAANVVVLIFVDWEKPLWVVSVCISALFMFWRASDLVKEAKKLMSESFGEVLANYRTESKMLHDAIKGLEKRRKKEPDSVYDALRKNELEISSRKAEICDSTLKVLERFSHQDNTNLTFFEALRIVTSPKVGYSKYGLLATNK